MGWLVGYAHRKQIDITAAVVQPDYNNPTSINISATKDTTLNQALATTNYGSGEYMLVSSRSTNKNQRTIIEFDVSAYTAGNALMHSAILNILYIGGGTYDPVGRTYKVYKSNRDSVEAQATWGVYSTGNSWATAGGMGEGDYEPTTPAPSSATVPASTLSWMQWDITAIVKDAITNCSSKVRLIIKDNNESSATEYTSTFSARDHATSGARPKLVISYLAATTPSVPSNYKLSFNVFKNEPTVETGSWTVNGKTYRHRVGFPIKVNDAISSSYAREVLIDTYSLVLGGFFANSTPATAKSVEFADEHGNSPFKYWINSTLGVVNSFNTPNTRYFIGLDGLSADTTYTRYLYLDPLITDASSNYDPSGVFAFFEDFTTTAANLTEFLAAYTKWEQDTTNAPTVTVADGVLTLTGGASEWQGIATKTTEFTQQNFRTFIRFPSSAIAIGVLVGMLDANGISDPQDGLCVHYQSSTQRHSTWKAGVKTDYPEAGGSANLHLLSGYSGDWQLPMIKDISATQPDAVANAHLGVFTDVAMKLNIASSVNGAAIKLDLIAVSPQLNRPPMVFFPDITYSSVGNIYLDEQCLHWPYDVAFTDGDGETLLKHYRSPGANLTKEPGITGQVQVRITDDLSSDQSIFVYYGNTDVTSDGADNGMIADDTFADTGNYYSTFDAVTDWTVKAGTWTVESIGEPFVFQGAAQGNALGVNGVNGGSRLWARQPNVMKWAENDFFFVCDNSLWEAALYWPGMYNPFIARVTSLTEPISNLAYWDIFPEGHDYGPGNTASVLKKFGTKAYFIMHSSKSLGHEVFSSSNPTIDPSSWTRNTNGPFFTGPWVVANSDGDTPTLDNPFNMDVVLDSGVYHIFITGCFDTDGSGMPIVVYYHTTDAPENWNSSTSFTYGGLLASFDVYTEDPQVTYDGSRYWYFYTTYINEDLTGTIKYKTLDTQSETFPTGTWSAWQDLNITLPPFAYHAGGPKIMHDGTNFWLHFWGEGMQANFSYPFTYWQPNWVLNGYAATPAGPWTLGITGNKYYQAVETGDKVSYVTDLTFGDGEIIGEVTLGQTATSGKFAGIVFRYNATSETGYVACVSYNTSTYVATIVLYKMTAAGTYTALGDTYTFSSYPIPMYQPGFPIRLRIKAYGKSLSVDYSTWGNDWINAITTTDTWYSSGKFGNITHTTKAWFDNVRIKQMVLTEPYANVGIFFNTILIKVSGVLKTVIAKMIKVSGAWKAISNSKIKVDGTWKDSI